MRTLGDDAETGRSTRDLRSLEAVRAARRMREKPGAFVVVAGAITIATALVALSTYSLLTPRLEDVSRSNLIALMTGHVLVAIGCAALVGWRLWRLFSNRRDGLAGSQLHIRLVGLFSLVAVAPAVLSFAFSALVLRSSLDEVFSERIGRAVDASRDFANGYVDLEANALGAALVYLQSDLQRAEQFGVRPDQQPIAYRQYLASQALARGFAALYVLDGDRRMLDRVYLTDESGVSGADRYALPPRTSFDLVDAAPELAHRFRFEATDPVGLEVFRGLLKIDAYGGGYLVAYKEVPPSITEAMIATRDVRDDYYNAERTQRRLERISALGFVTLALIILFGAVWLGLWAATAIVRPIAGLVSVAERVYSGDYDARADVERPDSELGVLARTFNRMTAQVQSQQNDLRRANAQVERRSRFTEAVLSGVSAGVLGVSGDGRITLANAAALRLLGAERQALVGAPLAAAAPELAALAEIARRDSGAAAAAVEIDREGDPMTLNVRITSDSADMSVTGETGSIVLTFDDVTELVDAQRAAAWGDVARRIAHEIKNPLTPIQLSAERLQRKYAGEITSNPDIFERCTQTIIRQVKDIGRMVDEFSTFARMPKPVFAREDVRELVKAAVFDRRMATADIAFESVVPPHPILVECDGRLIAQALGNLLKNAAESVAERLADDATGLGGLVRVTASAAGGSVLLTVEDNGVGLPAAERARLTEPYVTTRAKGTGLGLAIVKRVLEEHAGSFEIEDCASLGPTGACARLVLPIARDATGENLAEEPDDVVETAERPLEPHPAE